MLKRPKLFAGNNAAAGKSTTLREERLSLCVALCVAALRADLDEMLPKFAEIDFTKESAKSVLGPRIDVVERYLEVRSFALMQQIYEMAGTSADKRLISGSWRFDCVRTCMLAHDMRRKLGTVRFRAGESPYDDVSKLVAEARKAAQLVDLDPLLLARLACVDEEQDAPLTKATWPVHRRSGAGVPGAPMNADGSYVENEHMTYDVKAHLERVVEEQIDGRRCACCTAPFGARGKSMVTPRTQSLEVAGRLNADPSLANDGMKVMEIIGKNEFSRVCRYCVTRILVSREAAEAL